MKRWPLILSFVLFIALCASLAYWGMQLFKPPVRPVAAPPRVAKTAVAPESAAALFGGQKAEVATASNYQLRGVILSGNPRNSVAILSEEGKPAQAIRASKEIAPGVVVQEVHRQYVLLSENGVTKRVELPDSTKEQLSVATASPLGQSAARSPAPPAMPAPAQPQPPAQQQPPAQTQQQAQDPAQNQNPSQPMPPQGYLPNRGNMTSGPSAAQGRGGSGANPQGQPGSAASPSMPAPSVGFVNPQQGAATQPAPAQRYTPPAPLPQYPQGPGPAGNIVPQAPPPGPAGTQPSASAPPNAQGGTAGGAQAPVQRGAIMSQPGPVRQY